MTNEELTLKVIELDERTTRHTEQIKTLFAKTEENHNIVESLRKLTTTVEILAHEYKTISTKMDTLTGDVEAIKARPGRRWENTVRTVFELALAAVMAMILARIGLN